MENVDLLTALDLQSEMSVVLMVTLALGALLAGLILGRRGKSRLSEELEQSRRQLTRSDAQNKEHHRTLARMRDELDTVASLALHLPHVVRDLNRDDLDPRDVPRLIVQLANAIFQPAQVLLYGVRKVAGQDGLHELYLQTAHGLTEVPNTLKVIRFGEGRIGWVADHELDMTAEDWDKLARTDGLTVPNNHPSLRTDIVGALVHHARDSQTVLGVLCIGAPRIRVRDEKLMFQLVTNLGSLALVNSRNMAQLRQMANHDGLTRLLNKRYFTQTLMPSVLMTCEKEAQPLSLFIFDIDHFKNYNDTNGHPAGDDLLRTMGDLIRQALRPGDLACRYGGEEFLIAMPETDREAAFEQADRIREKIARTKLPHGENQPLKHISISGGVAAFPRDGNSISELIQHADEALYQSKHGGRNRVMAYKGVEIGDFSESLPPVNDLQPDDEVPA